MPKFAVLLIDLQKDFLDVGAGRMPIPRAAAETVLKMANDVLQKRVLADAMPILIVNRFPVSARIGNFFRKGAAVAGSAGAALDGRLHHLEGVRVIDKASPSAFSNPELDNVLLANDVQELYVLGVFAEACVRATVIDAIKLGFTVHVLADAVASNATWKRQFGLWAMKRAGADIVQGVPALKAPVLPAKQAIW